MDERFGEAAMAIVVGDHDELQRLIEADPSLATGTSSVSHPTLLQLVACEEANLPDPTGSAAVLLDAGADPSAPLVAAAGCNSAQTLDLLLARGVAVDGDDPRWTPLDEALYWDQKEIAASLVRRGATIRALSTAAGLGDLDEIERLLTEDDPGRIGSPFPDTVHDADDPQTVRDHAFVMAVNAGQRPAAERLLAAGADVNATPPGFHWRGTALHAAIWRGDRDLVAWLLDNGADPNRRDGMVDSDALGWAHHHEQPEIVALLSGD